MRSVTTSSIIIPWRAANRESFSWAHLCLCTVGSYAPLSVRPSVRLSVCLWLDQNSLEVNSYLRNRFTQSFVYICKQLLGIYQIHWWWCMALAGGLTSTSSCIFLRWPGNTVFTFQVFMDGHGLVISERDCLNGWRLWEWIHICMLPKMMPNIECTGEICTLLKKQVRM